MKIFNVTGVCVPHKHYMVDTSDKLAQIRSMIDRGDYFTINRGRQYGKTTTLIRLFELLKHEYTICRTSFEGIGDESFATPETFCQMLLSQIYDALEFTEVSEEYRSSWLDEAVTDFKKLSSHIKKLCKNHKVILMIDEVDKTSHNQNFLNFLSVLRTKYLEAQTGFDYTFHSVILAGVYDIKTIKLNLINKGLHTPQTNEKATYNSPWNIAADFEVDMSFAPKEIKTMLDSFETDANTGMDIDLVAHTIHKYTNGYPFLTSKICKIINEKISNNWTVHGVEEAVKLLASETNTLFDDLFKNLENNQDLQDLLYGVLINGEARSFAYENHAIALGFRYGYILPIREKVAISNKIFKMKIARYYAVKLEAEKTPTTSFIQTLHFSQEVTRNNSFDMELCLRGFAKHFREIYTDKHAEMLEDKCRLVFLTYLKPLLNGVGFYDIESQLTDGRRMDITVVYGSKRFILELKIWRGDVKHIEAHDQLLGYMESSGVTQGYLLTFDFRKERPATEPKWIDVGGGKQIYEVLV